MSSNRSSAKAVWVSSPSKQALRYAVAIADALAAAHQAGIIHRDLKPSNVLITEDGRVKVLDLGLAKLLESDASSERATTIAHTERGMVAGTTAYMSPEQADGQPLDGRSDIFSFGALLDLLRRAECGRTVSHLEDATGRRNADPGD